MLKKFLAISAAAIAACAALSGCGTNAYARYRRTFASFGAMATVYLDGEFSSDEQRQDAIDTAEEIGAILTSFENTFSTTIEDSDVCLFNAAAPGSTVGISEDMYNVLSLALEMYDETGGYYNAGVYYSVDLFGFSPRFNELTWQAPLTSRRPYDRLTENGGAVTALAAPEEEYVNIFKELASHMSELEVYQREGRYYAAKPAFTVTGPQGDEYSLALDLGGIGKGYAADVVTSMMAEYGFEYGFFDFGSSSVSALASHESQSGEWERRADYPTYETAGASAFAVGDDIIVCFGYYDHATNHVYAYNVPDDKWRWIDASACSGMEESIAGSVGGRHFVGTCARWYEYIAADGRWVTRSVIPNETSRLCAGAVTVSGSLFMIGGRVAWQDIKVYDEVWEYMVDADRWRLRGYTPNGGRENLVAFEIGGTVYVGFGENEDGEVLDDFYKMVIP